MANYPTSDPAFTTKQDGVDYPQAAHINDVQNEVVAIGTALRGTLQHGVSVSTGGFTASTGGLRVAGNSTIAGALQVTGDSTLTGNQTVSGGSTFGGPVVMSSGLTVTGSVTVNGDVLGGRGPVAHLRAASSQSVAIGVWTGLNWTIEDVDSTALHSTASDSSRVNLTSSGVWAFGGMVAWKAFGSNPSTCVIGIRVKANDNEGVIGDVKALGATADQLQFPHAITGQFVTTSTTAFLTLQVLQTVQNPAIAEASTGLGSGATQFWVRKVGA